MRVRRLATQSCLLFLALLSFIILGTWADGARAEDYPPLKGYFPFAHNFAPFDDWSATVPRTKRCAFG